MKYTTAAVLLPVASAASIDARQATELKYEISDFSAACTAGSIYCFYEVSIVTSNNPEFKQGCDAMGTSDNGELPAVRKTQCGTYTISVAKLDDGGLVLTINSGLERLTGTFTISSDDLTTTTSGESTVQSYAGDSAFTIDIKNASSASASASGATASTPTASPASFVSPSASSASRTTASEPSATSTTTLSSASPSETSDATRESACAGVLFAIGLMAFTVQI
ncbi:hypothetical protein BKA67DRAFT_661078 [Truncatella angustata]|uniref:Uncharacterized protein n=1 Tax=Truncatella angustata TaxID=152316 RepID=A0A9P8UHL2_9PEZI|nr:uncharacterized protein BKA67DRAFT_661078 [Truncatella angustata]KAH6652331.1 hypothetical protein BKA67DRAFT_661078 [Truncatella angustata]